MRYEVQVFMSEWTCLDFGKANARYRYMDDRSDASIYRKTCLDCLQQHVSPFPSAGHQTVYPDQSAQAMLVSLCTNIMT